ncbi:hypothetical protein V8C86DRAFT_2519412, partial [Haematococcus lacustris]
WRMRLKAALCTIFAEGSCRAESTLNTPLSKMWKAIMMAESVDNSALGVWQVSLLALSHLPVELNSRKVAPRCRSWYLCPIQWYLNL